MDAPAPERTPELTGAHHHSLLWWWADSDHESRGLVRCPIERLPAGPGAAEASPRAQTLPACLKHPQFNAAARAAPRAPQRQRGEEAPVATEASRP